MKYLGTGKTGSRDLSREDATAAMNAILDRRFHPVTFGAFFQALRHKGEALDEVAGLMDSLALRTLQTGIPMPANTVDCAGAYDGKQRTLNIGLPAALVTAAAGVPVLLHGNRDVPTKCGMTTSHILERLGIDWMRSSTEAAADLHNHGIAYLHQPVFHPGLDALLPLRRAMGKRTILNSIEPLLNPLGARMHVGGFFHDAYAEMLCRASAVANTGFDRVVLVKGIEGSDELRPGVMTFCELNHGEVQTHATDSMALGLHAHISELALTIHDIDAAATENAARIKDVLQGADTPAYRNSILLNAAVRLYTAGAASTLADAVPIAVEALESGRAAERLLAWQQETMKL